MSEQEIKDWALKIIYAVDYDIGKESDPDVGGKDDDGETVDDVCSVLRELLREGE